MKRFLFIMDQPPHGGSRVQEQLDMVLIAAAFDQPAALLFLGDGVFQLKSRQQPEALGYQDTPALFSALELYEVRGLFVETESLQERGLDAADLLMPVETLPRRDIAAFMQRFEIITGV